MHSRTPTTEEDPIPESILLPTAVNTRVVAVAVTIEAVIDVTTTVSIAGVIAGITEGTATTAPTPTIISRIITPGTITPGTTIQGTTIPDITILGMTTTRISAHLIESFANPAIFYKLLQLY